MTKHIRAAEERAVRLGVHLSLDPKHILDEWPRWWTDIAADELARKYGAKRPDRKLTTRERGIKQSFAALRDRLPIRK